MKEKFFLGLALIFLSLNFVVAQEQVSIVETTDANLFKVHTARLNNVITKNNGKFEEKFQFSFQLPNSFETSLTRAKVMLTAYKADGSFFGSHIWCSAALDNVEKISADDLRVTLDANPKLKGASKYGLTMIQGGDLPAPETTCPECVGLANDACGRGKIGSVTCGADGSCSFTCK